MHSSVLGKKIPEVVHVIKGQEHKCFEIVRKSHRSVLIVSITANKQTINPSFTLSIHNMTPYQ